jgi:streptogramin lyase
VPAEVSAFIPVADGPIGLAATSDAVWVEAHRANILTRIDPAQDLETDRLTDVPVHCGVAAGAGFVWTTQASSGTITKVDPATGEVVAKIRLGEACGIAADETGVWATSPGAGRAIRYDPETLDIQANVALGPLALAVAIDPDAVWVLGEADGGTLWRVDPGTNELVATIAVPVRFATGLAVGFGSVWVAGREERVVYRIEPATNAIAETIEMPGAIGGIGIGPDAVWASGFGDGTLHRIDPTTNEIGGSMSTGYGNLGPPLVAFESLWVAALDRNVVLRIDPDAVDE